MSRIEESLYSSVGKYGIELNESKKNESYHSNHTLYVASPGSGFVTKLRKQNPDYVVISPNNVANIGKLSNKSIKGVILDSPERFPYEIGGKLLSFIDSVDEPVIAVTYDKDELDMAFISQFRVVNGKKNESIKRRYQKRMTEDIDRQYEKEASEFCDTIRELASNEDALMTIDSYLSFHFDTWLKDYANTPSGLVSELKMFLKQG